MYPGGQPEVTVDPGPAGRVLEGEFRPGFFGGVLTVVLKLFHLTRPDVAVFGQKDAQQLALVRRMASDLDLDIVIESMPTVRDADGLATSSRNRYLSAADRALALALSAGAARGRRPGPPRARRRAGRRRADPPRECPPWPSTTWRWSTRPRSARSRRRHAGPALIVAAATVGGTRLIDNVPVVLAAGPAARRRASRDAADH